MSFLSLIGAGVGTLTDSLTQSGQNGNDYSFANDTTLTSVIKEMTSSGINLFEEEIDEVVMSTNRFICDSTFIGQNGPFWYILQMNMALGALFAIIMAAGMAYKMMIKGEAFDPLKIIRVLGIALVLIWWYPKGGVLDSLAFIPNCIGSWTHDLYETEAIQVQKVYDSLTPLLKERDRLMDEARAKDETLYENTTKNAEGGNTVSSNSSGPEPVIKTQQAAAAQKNSSLYAGLLVFADKIVMFLALALYRVGWWSTIYCQQIVLGMLTIFGPIQWAFSILPKWEGAWAKWTIRYLTVHFYGAMIYFVGFYVLLLFDIVLSLQYENLHAIVANGDTYTGYIHNTFMTAGYLLVASLVSLKCLNLVPDLAAWMIPEGESSFSTRNFGEGVASDAQRQAKSLIGMGK